MTQPLFVFIDESGNFDFSKSGTKFYVFAAVITDDPTAETSTMTRAHFDILSGELLPDLDHDYLDTKLCTQFHASEDKQAVRDVICSIVAGMDTNAITANAVVVQKNKTIPALREPKRFYSKFLGSLLAYVFKVHPYSRLCIFVNGSAVNKQQGIFKNAIVEEIRRRNPQTDFRIYFPKSGSFPQLQIADYVSWAVYRKWEHGDLGSYNKISHLLQAPEKDIFSNGQVVYY